MKQFFVKNYSKILTRGRLVHLTCVILFICCISSTLCIVEELIEEKPTQDAKLSTVHRLDAWPPSGEWTQCQLMDFDNDGVLEVLLYNWNGTTAIVNGSAQFLPGWPVYYPSSYKILTFPIAADFLNLNTPQIVALGNISHQASLLLLNNQGGLIQSHPIDFPPDARSHLVHLPQKDSTSALIVLWAIPELPYQPANTNSVPPTIWVFSPSMNECDNFSLSYENNTVSYVLPDYNIITKRWELFILTTNASVLRYTLSGDLIATYSHPNLTNTPSAILFSLPNPKLSAKLIICLNSTGEIVAWSVTGEVNPAWTKILDRPSTDGSWIGTYPLLADVTENGQLEVILTSVRPNKIYIFDSSGEILPGWPQTPPYPEIFSSIHTVPVIIDVNQDGTNEIMVGLYSAGFLFFDFQGNLLSVWDEPPPVAEYQLIDFLIGDITGDNRCEIIYSNIRGTVYAIETGWVGHAPWPQRRGPGTNIYLDIDYDLLSDQEELFFGTNMMLNDTDTDGLSDYTELIHHLTNPIIYDTDDDGLSDGEEITQYSTDPLNSDSDGDGLLDGEEVAWYATDPNSHDTDKDGLSDYEEVKQYGTNPTKDDTDGDRLLDGEEVARYATDPNDPDTDKDGLSDYEEIEQYGTDPTKRDTDHDLLPDGLEVLLQFNPRSASDVLIAISGLLVVLFAFSLAIYLWKSYRRAQQETWTNHLQQAKLGPLNIAKEAEKMHLSVELAHKWLNEALVMAHVSGLYNATTDLYISEATLDLWLETLDRIPLESLAVSLGLSLDELEQLLHRLEAVKQGDWIISADHQLQK